MRCFISFRFDNKKCCSGRQILNCDCIERVLVAGQQNNLILIEFRVDGELYRAFETCESAEEASRRYDDIKLILRA